MSAPTGPFRRFLLRNCSAATMERLVDPILTDIHIEAAAAAARGQQWASRRIRAAGTIALLKALTVCGWTRFWRFQEWPADDRRAIARTLAYSAAVGAAAIPLLILPLLLRVPASRVPELIPYLVPQTLPIALPVGLFIGLVYGFRAASLRPRVAVTIAAILCSAASFVALAWVVPTSNQAFRVAALQDSRIPKGLPELTLGELRRRIKVDERRGRDLSRVTMTYHSRWALAAAPVVLTAWAFLLIGRLPTRGRWPLGIVAVASCVAYSILMSNGRYAVFDEMLPPTVGAWLPNLVFVAAIVLLVRRTPNVRTTNGNLPG
jgi:hypothetical protein